MISTKGRYAIRVMIDISEQRSNGYIPLKDIAERQGISKKYLEIITKELVRKGFLEGLNGRGGGYKLCRPPEKYSVGEILESLEGSMAAVACLAKDATPCPRAPICKTLPMWTEYDDMTHDFFYKKTLADLIK
ncbi:MAG: Rrf2 family transcriptional regulator [Phascolarctobacterium sp.]|nr:Rrf2 family transcriptional regulator [Phascolarctobacterium sp.]